MEIKGLRVIIDGSGARAGAAVVRNSLDKIKAKSSEFSQKFRSNLAGVREEIFSLRGAISSLAVVAAVKEVVDATVRFEALQTSLKFASGSAENAAASMVFIRSEAKRLGIEIEVLADSYKGFTAAARGTALEGKKSRDIFVAIAEASKVVGMNSEQTGGALKALEQMISKGKVSAEELRGQLGERLPGAFQIAARAMNMTTAELDKMMSDGKLMADDFLPRFGEQIRKEMGGSVDEASKTAASAFSRLNNAVLELKLSIGKSGLVDAIANAAEVLADLPTITDNVVTALAASFDKLVLDVEYDFNKLDTTIRNLYRNIVTDTQIGANSTAENFLRAVGTEFDIDWMKTAADGYWNQVQLLNGTKKTNAQIEAAYIQHSYNLEQIIKDKKELIDQAATDLFANKDRVEAEIAKGNYGFTDNPITPSIVPKASIDDKKSKKKSEAERELDRLTRKAEQLTNSMRTPLEKYEDKLFEINDLYQENLISYETYTRAVADAQDNLNSHMLESTEATADQLANVFTSSFTDLIKGDFKSIGDAFTNMIDGMVSEWMNAQFKKGFQTGDFSLGGNSVFDGIGSSIGNFFGSDMFAGFFADGGNIPAGKWAVAGEQGAELIRAGSSSTVLSNDQVMSMLGGNQGGNTTVNITISGVKDEGNLRQTMGQLGAELATKLDRSRRNL